jgi:hypothetical protein
MTTTTHTPGPWQAKYKLSCSNLPLRPRWVLVKTAGQLKSAIGRFAGDRGISELAVIAWEVEC